MIRVSIPTANKALNPLPWAESRTNTMRTIAQRELAQRELARRDYLHYIKLFRKEFHAAPVHKLIARRIDKFIRDVEEEKEPRLIIEMPPRHGKSTMISEDLAPYVMGKHPDWQLLGLTYGSKLSTKFGRKVRARLNDPIQLDLFPKLHLDPSTNSADLIETQENGSYRATGMGGDVTGRGAHVMIIDDPVKGYQEADSETQRENQIDWYNSVARTRMMPGGGIIIVLTRWHEEDLAGYVQARAEEDPEADQWDVLRFPAIAEEDEPIIGRKRGQALHPERYPISRLRRIQKSIKDPRVWSALYQQNPTPEEGLFFSAEKLNSSLRPLRKIPDASEMRCYVTCDLAITQKTYSDYTAIVPFGVDADGVLWVLPDIQHRRMGSDEMVSEMLRLATKYNAFELIIERTHVYHAIREYIKRRMRETNQFFSIRDPFPSSDKTARAQPLRGRIVEDMVRLPDTSFIRDVLLPEFISFPNGKHDDLVDALAWGCSILSKQLNGTKGLTSKSPVQATDPDVWDMERIKRSVAAAEARRKPNKRTRSLARVPDKWL